MPSATEAVTPISMLNECIAKSNAPAMKKEAPPTRTRIQNVVLNMTSCISDREAVQYSGPTAGDGGQSRSGFYFKTPTVDYRKG